MKSFALRFIFLVFVSLSAACGNGSSPPTPLAAPTISIRMDALTPTPMTLTPTTGVTDLTCSPTLDDGISPTYKPNAPFRTQVGHGHVLTGVVRSSRDCLPIAGAQLELWPEYAGQGHPDQARATLLTGSDGRYRFECDPPEHIHMRISAAGYRTIAQNSYHPDGQKEGVFDIVLAPESP